VSFCFDEQKYKLSWLKTFCCLGGTCKILLLVKKHHLVTEIQKAWNQRLIFCYVCMFTYSNEITLMPNCKWFYLLCRVVSNDECLIISFCKERKKRQQNENWIFSRNVWINGFVVWWLNTFFVGFWKVYMRF